MIMYITLHIDYNYIKYIITHDGNSIIPKSYYIVLYP